MRGIAVALSLVLAALAGDASADGWQALDGGWRGDGTVNGMPASIELEFRTALERRGRHLRFRNRMQHAEGERVFSAEALYLCGADGACRGHWYDSRGVVLPLTVAVHPQHLVVDWGDEATERGRTTYRVGEDGLLEITDEVRGKDGAWKVFGQTRARRR
jgi:hypothetical protein